MNIVAVLWKDEQRAGRVLRWDGEPNYSVWALSNDQQTGHQGFAVSSGRVIGVGDEPKNQFSGLLFC